MLSYDSTILHRRCVSVGPKGAYNPSSFYDSDYLFPHLVNNWGPVEQGRRVDRKESKKLRVMVVYSRVQT